MNKHATGQMEALTTLLDSKGYKGDFKLVGRDHDFQITGSLSEVMKSYLWIADSLNEFPRFSLHFVSGASLSHRELTRLMIKYDQKTGFRVEKVIKVNVSDKKETTFALRDNNLLPDANSLNVKRAKPKGMRRFCFKWGSSRKM